ncbi:DHA2 family efflux MFS transporter permease subunit [Brachybacterium sp. Z12]|uniref:DHA2 family efflux MFS transporter permease subunit n=1 Tax=Brachybacterium sp. Z12 TaxID=2759167 RepID=UPI001862DB9F|nr:DHA2 family efflux MFS transporter permease subunit [Brachybacterium sp. Z12]QNN82886.1 DHA2 family efflux MFS transporter permease subunit [Brachybacterium sp. Z12]
MTTHTPTPTGEFPALEAPGIVAGGSAAAEAEFSTRDGADDPSTTVVDGHAPASVKVTPIIAVLVVSAFVMILNETLLSVALPTLMEDLSISAVTAQWLSTGFMLTMAVVIPTTGFLMKRLSVRTVFSVAMLLFLAGTTIAMLAPTFPVLLGGRVIQAAGTAMVLPLLMTTVLALVPIRSRGLVMGLVGVVISAAPALGPSISGFILQHGTWHHLFLMMLPIIVIALTIGLLFMRNYTEPEKVRLDVISVILSAIGFGGVIYALASISQIVSGTSRLVPLLVAGIGVLALTVFTIRQLRMLSRGDEPLLDLQPLKVRTFTVSVLVILMGFATMLGTVVALPLYMTGALEMTTLEIGLTMLPGAAASGLLGPFVGALYDRFGPRPIVVPGMLLMAIVCWLEVFLLDANATQGLIIALNIPLGIGMAMVMTPLMTLSLGALPRSLYGHGSAILNTLQQLAGALGTAVFIALLTLGSAIAVESGASAEIAQASGASWAFAFGGVVTTVAVVLAFTLKANPAEVEAAG